MYDIGWGIVSNSWEFGAPGNDGEGAWPIAPAHVEESRVSDSVIINIVIIVFGSIFKG